MARQEAVRRNNIILILLAVAIVAAGFIYGYTRPTAAPDQPDVTASVQQPQREAQDLPAAQPAGESEKPSEPSEQAPAATAPPLSLSRRSGFPFDVAQGGERVEPQPDTSDRISEEHYINICVEIVIAAQGFKNAGQGNDELITYIPELFADEGVTEEAFDQTTQRITSDPQQGERVAKEILKRVEARTGLKMDVGVLPIMNPDIAVEAQ